MIMTRIVAKCTRWILGLTCLFIADVTATAGDESSLKLDEVTRARCLSVLRTALGDHARDRDAFWPAMHAAEALSLAGYGSEVQATLTPLLDAEADDQRRCGLARELVRAGDRSSVAELLSILGGDDDYGHVHAAESLYKVNEIGDGSLLRAAMSTSENSSEALMAAAALARWGSPSALTYVRDRVTADDANTSRIAAWVLGRLGNASDIELLKTNVQRFDDPVAVAFFQHALAALGDADGLASLRANLTIDDPAIRPYAATFAGETRDTSLTPGLMPLLDDPHDDTRIRAAQSLLQLSLPDGRDTADNFARLVYPASDLHPRNSEGSVIVLADGSLLFAVSEFSGGGADDSRAQIVAATSRDGGRSWVTPRVLQPNVGAKNVMSVTLRRLADPSVAAGPIGLFYLVKNSSTDLNVFLRVSSDEGRTLGEPVQVTDQPGYHVMNNDRVTHLSSGRLLVPVSSTGDVRKENHFVCSCYLSDNAGADWRRSQGSVDYARRGAMEPEVIELDDGRVAMFIRTQLGHIAVSYSSDGGDTWGEAKSSGVAATESPATIRRIPSTGDLLMIWNPEFRPGADHGGRRTPLAAAVSSDEGKTWHHRRDIEPDEASTYAYTSLTFDRGRALLSYYVSDGEGRASTKFRSLPIAWFYDDSSTTVDSRLP